MESPCCFILSLCVWVPSVLSKIRCFVINIMPLEDTKICLTELKNVANQRNFKAAHSRTVCRKAVDWTAVPSGRYRTPAHTNKISPSVLGLQATHAVHGLTAIAMFAIHLPMCFSPDSSSRTIHVAIARALCKHGAF
jgi:hypothetical protein